ncbi:MAG: SDR family NAD(P)-dependent oxidoreductase [Planctomycetes bacterium]|nr:SDR family NAD(P)-dependent oxidoreductase [Planctomycetota bacterium]
MSGAADVEGARAVLVVGHSDGIGREVARQLLASGRRVVGISRRRAEPDDGRLAQIVQDVAEPAFATVLAEALAAHDVGTVVHCAAIGGGIDPAAPDLAAQPRVLRVNLGSMATALDVATRHWLSPDWRASGGGGHFVGLSSLADLLAVPRAPGYAASKAAVSSLLRAAAVLLRPHGIAVTNVRFGYVDTKLAHGAVRPLMLTREAAARRVLRCLRTRPSQCSSPWLAALGVRAVAALQWLRRPRW